MYVLAEVPTIPQNVPTWVAAIILLLWAAHNFVYPIIKDSNSATKKDIEDCHKKFDSLMTKYKELDQKFRDTEKKHQAEIALLKEQHQERIMLITDEKNSIEKEHKELLGYIKGVRMLLEKQGIKI